MGAYFVIANLDKHEYLCGGSLGISARFHAAQSEPLGSLLVWVLAKTSYVVKPPYQGRWAGDRIVVAADEGETSGFWDQCQEGFRNITVAVFEEWVADDVFRKMRYWQQGWIQDDARLVGDTQMRRQLAEQRQDKEPPFLQVSSA